MNPKETKWFNELSNVEENGEKVSDEKLIDLQEEAKKILSSETANYNIKRTKTNSDYRWIKTVMTKGTVADKVAAYIVTIQDNPVFNLDTINNMIGMVKASKKKECIAVIDSLCELFLTDLLRPMQQLRTFEEQTLSQLDSLASGNVLTRRKYLSHWYFESQLKSSYNEFVQALNTVSHDSVEANKEKAIGAMAKLLAGNPEQEKNLLSHIINKLGDPSQKVGSKTIYCLTQILNEHPNMQGIVLKEIEKLLYRQNIGRKAQYYSLCFLSQFHFSNHDSDLPSKLIDVYFSFFRKCVKEGDVDSRMMSVLLIGVNRAYPYADIENDKLSEHIDTMYRIVHVSNFNVSLNTLVLLFQVAQSSDNVNDRFYSALYKKLLDENLPSYANPAILLNLVYKAMLRDMQRERIAAFIKRLLQLALHVQANLACGIVFLVSQISFKKQNLRVLLFNSENADTSTKMTQYDDDDDEDERYFDNANNANDKTTTNASWIHRKKTKGSKKKFDPQARNPLYAHSELSSHFELVLLKHHFHPSMQLFVANLLDGTSIAYSGDPLKDFAPLKFLERFVFKNPKKSDEMQNVSLFARRSLYQPSGSRGLPVMSNDFLQQDEANVPVDEHYLFQYMKRRYADDKIRDGDAECSDNESVADEDFDAMLAGMSKLPDDEDELDFMQEIGQEQSLKKNARKERGADSEDKNISDDEEISDELDSDMDDVDDDDDVSDDGSEEETPKKKKSRKTEDVFAAAEEFAALLEDEGSASIAPGSLHQMGNKDKAAKKQLDWESKRNHWIQSYKRKVHGGGGKMKKRHFKQ